jgi:hypothetical protein
MWNHYKSQYKQKKSWGEIIPHFHSIVVINSNAINQIPQKVFSKNKTPYFSNQIKDTTRAKFIPESKNHVKKIK